MENANVGGMNECVGGILGSEGAIVLRVGGILPRLGGKTVKIAGIEPDVMRKFVHDIHYFLKIGFANRFFPL